MKGPPSVAAVVCTFNRDALLFRCLSHLAAQSPGVNEIVLVDNSRKSSTAALLLEHYPYVTHLVMPENLGPAGGFAAGMRHAYQRGHEWLWLFNDDAFPEPGALSQCLTALHKLGSKPGVLTTNATKTPSHEPRSVEVFHFNGALVSRDVIERVGYPIAEYFMCHEEAEYSSRIISAGFSIVDLPPGLVVHDNAGSAGRSPPWRGYYQTRNELRAALARKSARLAGVWLWKQMKFGVAILLQLDCKRERLAMRLLGAWHAVCGIEGRTIDPARRKS